MVATVDDRRRALVSVDLDGIEERLDGVLQLARRVFDVPGVALNLITEDQQLTVAAAGLPVGENSLDTSFCIHTVASGATLVVGDASGDSRFATNPLVTGPPGIRFYAGEPIVADGEPVGALCVIDSQPRGFTDADRSLLSALGRLAESELHVSRDAQQSREIQRRLLPAETPDVPGFEVAGACLPARHVGGDFYDWQVVDGCLQVVLADVMGKGLPAAVTAAGARAVFRGTSRFNDLATSVLRTDRSLQDDLAAAASFVTLFAARLDPDDGSFEYVDAGHGIAMVAEATGDQVRQLDHGGLPMGVVPEEVWTVGTHRLEPGDSLVIASDGALESYPDLKSAVTAVRETAGRSRSARELVAALVEQTETSRSTDDSTLLVVRRSDR